MDTDATSAPISTANTATWEDLDVRRLFTWLSATFSAVRGLVDRSAKESLPRAWPLHRRRLGPFLQTSLSEMLQPLNHVIIFFAVRTEIAYKQALPHLRRFFPAGTEPPVVPLPEDLVKKIIGPQVILPLFRKHYIFFRVLILAFAFGLDGQVYRPEQGELVRSFSVESDSTSLLHLVGAEIVEPIACWTVSCPAVAKRITSDTCLLESLLKVALFGVRYVSLVDDDVDSEVIMNTQKAQRAHRLFGLVLEVIYFVVPLNAVSLAKDMRERYPGELLHICPAAQLRAQLLSLRYELIKKKGLEREAEGTEANRLDDALGGAISMTNILLGHSIIVDADDPKGFKYVPMLEGLAKGIAKRTVSEYATAENGSIVDFCDVCGLASNNLKRCSQCLVARFCNPECQRNGYSEHKKVCFDGKTGRTTGVTEAMLTLPED